MYGRMVVDAVVGQLFRWRPVRWFFGILAAALVLSLVIGVIGAL